MLLEWPRRLENRELADLRAISPALQSWGICPTNSSTKSVFLHMQAISVRGQPDDWMACRIACCWKAQNLVSMRPPTLAGR